MSPARQRADIYAITMKHLGSLQAAWAGASSEERTEMRLALDDAWGARAEALEAEDDAARAIVDMADGQLLNHRTFVREALRRPDYVDEAAQRMTPAVGAMFTRMLTNAAPSGVSAADLNRFLFSRYHASALASGA